MIKRLVSICLSLVSVVGFLVAGVKAEAVVKKAESLQPGNAKEGTLKFKGYVQGRYERFDLGTKADTFRLKSAYLTAYGTVVPAWDFEIEIDASDNTGKPVRSAFISLAGCPNSKIRFGQQKVSFTEEYWTSSTMLDTIERSLPVTNLSHERDTGINVLADLLEKKINLGIGVFNGNGINATDTNDRKDIIGRITVSPFKGSPGALDGLTLGVGIWSGKQAPSGPATGDRKRYTGLLVYKYELIKLQGEYLFQKLGQTGIVDKKGKGLYVFGTGDVIKDVFQLVAKYETYDADNTVGNDKQNVSTCGVNVFLNTNTKIMANYRILGEDADIDNNEFLTQLQVKF
ncbi:MAG: porin [Elusimicrobiota bacterium]